MASIPRPISDESVVDEVLLLVRNRTGLDFRGYRPTTVLRRVRNRMARVGAEGLAAYLGLLEGSEAETAALVDRLCVKVSRLFRNAPAFDLLRERVLPELATAAAGKPLRVWSAGCGHGEEPFTLAMLLEERQVPGCVLATDIDRAALEQAANAVYGEAALRELPPTLRERFMEPVPGPAPRWRVGEAVRRRVALGFDDLTTPAKGRGCFQLVSCRNVLIYLRRPIQERVMRRIADSMAPGGYLLLGEAEWPPRDAMPSFHAVAPRPRLFRAAATQPLAP